MSRTLGLVSLFILILIAIALFSAVFNAPHMLDSYAEIENARAYQAAAEAIQIQAKAISVAVLGMVCLTGILGLIGQPAASGLVHSRIWPKQPARQYHPVYDLSRPTQKKTSTASIWPAAICHPDHSCSDFLTAIIQQPTLSPNRMEYQFIKSRMPSLWIRSRVISTVVWSLW